MDKPPRSRPPAAAPQLTERAQADKAARAAREAAALRANLLRRKHQQRARAAPAAAHDDATGTAPASATDRNHC